MPSFVVIQLRVFHSFGFWGAQNGKLWSRAETMPNPFIKFWWQITFPIDFRWKVNDNPCDGWNYKKPYGILSQVLSSLLRPLHPMREPHQQVLRSQVQRQVQGLLHRSAPYRCYRQQRQVRGLSLLRSRSWRLSIYWRAGSSAVQLCHLRHSYVTQRSECCLQ